MAQFARPDADITDGGFSNELASNVNLFASLDEVSPNDSDYIQSPLLDANASAVTEQGLSNVTDPEVHTGHLIRFRASEHGPATDPPLVLAIRLKQGVTTIATFAQNLNSGQVATTFTYNLSEAQAAAITDYTALSIQTQADAGSAEVGALLRVSWMELEVPDAGSTTRPMFRGN